MRLRERERYRERERERREKGNIIEKVLLQTVRKCVYICFVVVVSKEEKGKREKRRRGLFFLLGGSLPLSLLVYHTPPLFIVPRAPPCLYLKNVLRPLKASRGKKGKMNDHRIEGERERERERETERETEREPERETER